MFNDIVIGPITIHMYGVMIAAGFLAALLMTLRRGKKRGYDEDLIWGIFFCAIIGGMLGTRILYYIVEIPEILKTASAASAIAVSRNGAAPSIPEYEEVEKFVAERG